MVNEFLKLIYGASLFIGKNYRCLLSSVVRIILRQYKIKNFVKKDFNGEVDNQLSMLASDYGPWH